MDWGTVIRSIAPKAKTSIVDGVIAAMPHMMSIANLNSPLRQAHFLAQLAHESAGFTTTEEFASGAAYEGRKDLGNVERGDGKRFKGRGLIQLTGRSNYKTYGQRLGVDFITDPTIAGKFPWAAVTAAVYWRDRGLNRYADRDDVRAVTRLINGGSNGLSDRERYLKLAKRAIEQQIAPTPVGNQIRKAQERLASLNYALGAIDGKIGPLTRSAFGDFQDAMGEPVTGELDVRTYGMLMSEDALKRPVSAEREELTAKDLKERGSEIIIATDGVKANVATATSALAAASGVATQVNDIHDKVNTVTSAIENGQESLSWFAANWQIIAIFVLLLIVAFCIWRIWRRRRSPTRKRSPGRRRSLKKLQPPLPSAPKTTRSWRRRCVNRLTN